jgi:flagellar biosynthesis protein FlhF
LNNTINISMATCKVVAPSSREALRLVRERLGPDAIVLSNRVTADGVEIVATVEESVARMTAAATPIAFPGQPPAAAPPSTVRPSLGLATDSDGDSVLREIHSMRGMIEEQLAGLSWNERQRGDPVRGHLLRTLLGAGFSARLAKDILENLPTDQSYASGMDYVKSELARQMPMLENESALMAEGGVYALMGPTGVGKTTTTAKLAARCIMRFGSEKLALVTTDSYRIGAYEQLRIYGQILGVSVHAVKDAADLDRVLADLCHKHMVLIDTVGMSQRDRAVSDQIAMLCGASRPVKRLLLLNASSHGDTLNEVVQAYRHGEQKAGSTDLAGCIFTKVDEATHPGALIDMAIRHQLPVHYISNGQKVPEHLVLANRNVLIDRVFQAKSQSALFVPGEADLDERPETLSNEAEVAAAEAVSERLRSQCQQLIRALTHNAQELTSNATALANGQIGFEETRALWRKLSDDQVGGKAIAQTLLSQALVDINTSCSDYVLAVAGEISLASEEGADPCEVASTLLLSDRNGMPFAAPHQLLAGPTQPGIPKTGWVQQLKLGKPVVHLFARIPAFGLIHEWQSSGIQWAACGTAALRIVDARSGTPGTLAKLAAGLSFSAAQPVTYRRKPALLSVAEALVSLRLDPKDSTTGAEAASSTLRCVVRRIVDADSGLPLAHGYLLASTSVQATAHQMSQWPAWRTAAEPYFKLLKQGISQLGGGGLAGDVALRKRLLVAGQTSTTVFRLQSAQDAWAETARKALAELAGRSVRPDRPVPGPALFEGLGKLFALLDAMETDDAALSPPSHMPQAQV